MNLELCYAPTTCALVPYVTLTEAGADFATRPINLRAQQHYSPEYLSLNPKRKVPVLIIDGEPLTENVAIQIWIARAFPDSGLLPRDPQLEIRAIAFMVWCASGIHPMLTPNFFPQRYCDTPGTEESVRRCARKALLDNYAVAEQALAGKVWLFGQFTAADAYFFWCFRRGTQTGMDLSSFTNCQAHFTRMQLRPSVQQVLAFESRVLDEFARPS